MNTLLYIMTLSLFSPLLSMDSDDFKGIITVPSLGIRLDVENKRETSTFKINDFSRLTICVDKEKKDIEISSVYCHKVNFTAMQYEALKTDIKLFKEVTCKKIMHWLSLYDMPTGSMPRVKKNIITALEGLSKKLFPQEYQNDQDHLQIQKILKFAYTCEKSISQTRVKHYDFDLFRKAFLSLIEKSSKAISTLDFSLFLKIAHERKQYFLGNNKKTPIFIDDKTLEKLCTFIFNERKLHTLTSNPLTYFLQCTSDPLLMRQLLYEHTILPIQKNGSLSGNENYQTSILLQIISSITKNGFFIGNTTYKGTESFNMSFCKEVDMPWAQEQTEDAQKIYLKTLFSPYCVKNFNVSHFSRKTTNRITSFMLCLNLYKKNSKEHIPVSIVNTILKHIALYKSAKYIEQWLIKESHLCATLGKSGLTNDPVLFATDYKDSENIMEFIKGGEFLQWFKKESLH